MSNPFDVDPDVSRAATPPGWVYGDLDLHHRLVERVLAPSWQALDGPDPAPGRAEPCTLLAGALDEPLVRTAGADGRAWIGSNVCTHRGAVVCDQACEARELRCPYHGRAFDLTGRLQRAPGFEGAEGFPRAQDDLRGLPLEGLGPLRFTSLADEPGDFGAWIAPARDEFGWCGWDTLVHDPAGDAAYPVEASWLLYLENYLEGFHIPWVHPGLREAIDGATYRTHTAPEAVVQLADARPDEPALEAPDGARLAAVYLWLFPNLMLNIYPWGLSLNRVVPEGPARTRIEYRRWIRDAALLGQGAGGDLDQVEREDQTIVRAVQRGVRSRLYPGGRYAPRHEVGTHHLHRLLAAALG